MSPIVSVIIPCYNAERWVAGAIESALGQASVATEVIVVNDGSKDRSLEAAGRYASRGVRVIDQRNRGAAAARNAGLRAARGVYVQFLDADDLLAPDKLENQLPRLAAAGPGALASGAWARFSRDPGEAEFAPQPNWRDMTGVEFLQIHYERLAMMHPAAWLAPRELLERAGPWDESLTLNDDGEYFARVMLAADRILFCGGARSYYRSNLDGSLSGRRDRRAMDSLYRSAESTIGRLLGADSAERTRAAAAHGWKWTSFELYPEAPDLSRAAARNARDLGGSRLPYPAGRRFQLLSRMIGWRLAKRMLLSR